MYIKSNLFELGCKWKYYAMKRVILKCVLFEQNMLNSEKMKVEIKHYPLTSFTVLWLSRTTVMLMHWTKNEIQIKPCVFKYQVGIQNLAGRDSNCPANESNRVQGDVKHKHVTVWQTKSLSKWGVQKQVETTVNAEVNTEAESREAAHRQNINVLWMSNVQWIQTH